MQLNKRGQATAGEIILIVILFAMLVAAGWYALSKKTESNTFHDKSQQIVHNHYYITRKYSLFDFVFSPFNFGGCARRPDTTGELDTTVVQDVNSVVDTNKE